MTVQERRSWRLAITGLVIAAVASTAWAVLTELDNQARVLRVVCGEEPTC